MFVAAYLDKLCPLNVAEFMDPSLRVWEGLVRDPVPAVAKEAVIAFGNCHKLALRFMAVPAAAWNEHYHNLWLTAERVRHHVFSCFPSAPESVLNVVLKAIETFIISFTTPRIQATIERHPTEFNIALAPADNPVLPSLRSEAEQWLLRILEVLKTGKMHATSMQVAISAAATIGHRRAQHLPSIIDAMVKMTESEVGGQPNGGDPAVSMAHLPPSQRKRVHHTLKTALLGHLNLRSARPLWDLLLRGLSNMGHVGEAAVRRAKMLRKHGPADEAPDGGRPAKARKLDEGYNEPLPANMLPAGVDPASPFALALSKLVPNNQLEDPICKQLAITFASMSPVVTADMALRVFQHTLGRAPPAPPDVPPAPAFVQFVASIIRLAKDTSASAAGGADAASVAEAQKSALIEEERKVAAALRAAAPPVYSTVPPIPLPTLSADHKRSFTRQAFLRMLSSDTDMAVAAAGAQELRSAIIAKLVWCLVL